MQIKYSYTQKLTCFPHFPYEGSIDLTYRCNNNCRHCWLRIPVDSSQQGEELSVTEIIKIVDEARSMGCRKWTISGGEPMLRPDFCEIFDYLATHSVLYSLNTNGTLITPEIAKILRRKGEKVISLYGATSKVYDRITRKPGSFEALMRGFRYLKEAGANFIVQVVPMKDNYHQFNEMVNLARSLSKYYRIGASLFCLSAYGDSRVSQEIRRQRLPPAVLINLDKPDICYEEKMQKENSDVRCGNDNYNFSHCIKGARGFHVDAYGKMSFCGSIKDPRFRYDLRKGNFREGWENFIPSLGLKYKVVENHRNSCYSCSLRQDCQICSAFAYLEHRSFNKKIGYLCAVAKEKNRFKENWWRMHRRYYKIADITIQVDSELPINKDTFNYKFKQFEVSTPGEDVIKIRHYFIPLDLKYTDLGREVYHKYPWNIYIKDTSWVYASVANAGDDEKPSQLAIFNQDYSHARILNNSKKVFLKGGLNSLTLFQSDQILLAQVLADRQGFYLHSCGAILKGKGLLFVGHSGSGKSTMAGFLNKKSELLCDDRIIVRKKGGVIRIYGTWSHGDILNVSANSAPLKAILFLNKSEMNYIDKLQDNKIIARKLLSCLIKPFATIDWWNKSLALLESVISTVPCYELYFNKNGNIIELLEEL